MPDHTEYQRSIISRIQKRWKRWKQRLAGDYIPFYPTNVDPDTFISDICRTLNIDEEYVDDKWRDYHEYYACRQYSTWLGESKTLSFEESFVILLLMDLYRPGTIVEIGTQYGKSTRKILDAASLIELESSIVCYDIVDEVRYFAPCEARLVLRDVTDSVRQDVLADANPGLIFLDARPYDLLRNVILEVLSDKNPRVLVIHDCSQYLCNPRMKLDRKDLRITSETGIWERHVLAELFGVSNPLDPSLDHTMTQTHTLTIFGTQHGLGLVMPKQLLLLSRDGRLGIS